MIARADRDDRPYDVVLFGATGFTGALTAQRLAADGPDDLRWAIAGRNETKLQQVREQISDLGKAGTTVEIITADVTDEPSMRRLAERTRVVATTVGPFVEYGEPLVAACADVGTDYADITGESEFVDRMWLSHHASAVESGARLVHACGFDSIPHDLGAYLTVQHLPEDAPITVSGYVRAGGQISGGTYRSAVRAFSRLRQSSATASQRRKEEPRRDGRRVGSLPQRPHRAPDGRSWALPLPTIDPVVVRRSARALDRYGPEFRYGHYTVVRRLRTLVVAPVILGGMVAAAQLPPGRDLLLKWQAPGDGPSQARRAKSWFTVQLVGEGGGERVEVEVSGGDPGYDETSRMLAQSALCLAFDDLPDTAGQVTTVQAMGDALLARLRASGLRFEVVR